MANTPQDAGTFSNLNTKIRLTILPNQKDAKTGQCKIYCEITTSQGARHFKRLDTEQTCSPEDWSHAKEQVKARNKDYQDINKKIAAFKRKVEVYLKEKSSGAA